MSDLKIVNDNLYISPKGHMHRHTSYGTIPLKYAIVLNEDLLGVAKSNIDSIIDIAKNNQVTVMELDKNMYYKRENDKVIRLHKHYSDDRTMLGENVTIFTDDSVKFENVVSQVKKVLGITSAKKKSPAKKASSNTKKKEVKPKSNPVVKSKTVTKKPVVTKNVTAKTPVTVKANTKPAVKTSAKKPATDAKTVSKSVKSVSKTVSAKNK